jgi:hypothetical protein
MKLEKLNPEEVKVMTREELLTIKGGTTGTTVKTAPKSIMLAEMSDNPDDYGD